MRASHLIFLLGLTACGNSPTASHTQSLFGTLDIKLLPETSARSSAPALGSLLVQLKDPENPGQVFALPECSGIQLSRRHVLTAGHCDRAGYIFSKNYLAIDTDLTAFQVSTLGPELRLVFTGSMIPAEVADESRPAAAAAVWKDTTLDAAILEFTYDLPDGWVDFLAPEAPVSSLVHYGYPNGMPLAASATCHQVPGADPAHFQHDCDSLGGSSGGLLVDALFGFPVGMQLAGPGINLSSYYLANGHFESPEDFAARRGCTHDAFPDPAGYASCVRQRGLNTAVRFDAVSLAAAAQNPQLVARILAASFPAAAF